MEFLSLSRRRSSETSPVAKSEEKRMFSQAILESLKSRIGRSYFLQHFLGETPSHARHAASSTALVQTWMDQSETLLLFFAETNQRQSCPRIPQSSSSLSSKCAEELWVEIEYSMHCINYAKREQEKPLLFTLTLRSRFVLSRGQSPLSRAISRVWPVNT